MSRFSKLIFILLIAVSPYASGSPCSQVHVTRVDSASHEFVLEPERGSAEHRGPGITKQMVELIERIERGARDPGLGNKASELMYEILTDVQNMISSPMLDRQSRYLLKELYQQLMIVGNALNNSDPATPHFRNNRVKLVSTSWETLVALQFRGRYFFHGKTLRELFPQVQRIPETANLLSREIDMAIQTGPKSWVLVEVKNWKLRSLKQEDGINRIVAQGRAVAQLKKELPTHAIQHVLVLRRGNISIVDRLMNSGLAYDRIRFLGVE